MRGGDTLSKIITAITGWFRSLLWSIAEIFLFLLDCLWQVVLKIGTLNIGGSKVTTRFFAVMSVCMLIFIVFKLVKIYIKFFIDNDYRERINLSKVLISLSLAATLISGLPLGYKIVCNMSSEAIAHVNYWIPSDFAEASKKVDKINMSDVLIQSGRVNLSNREADLGEEIKLDENFDINATYDRSDYVNDLFSNIGSLDEESMTSENSVEIMKSIAGIIGYGSKTYKYFPTWSSIILEILLSVVALFIFALTAIQIAMRSVICSMKYLLAPYMVASIIDPEDNSFGTWIRSIGGDLIANFCQIYFTYFVLILCSNSSIQDALGNDWIGIFAKIALFIGGLLAIQEIPNFISQFFGSSGQSMMETMRGTMMMGSMLMLTGGAAAKTVGMGIGAGKFAYQTEKAMTASYNDAGGGMDGIKSAGGEFFGGIFEKGVTHSNTNNNNEEGTSQNNNHTNFREEHRDSSNHSQGEHTDNNNVNPTNSNNHKMNSFNDMSKEMLNPLNDDIGGKTYISPEYQGNEDYDSYLNAAKYYGIDNAESMSKDELKAALNQKGYKYTSMKNFKGSFNNESYKTNIKSIKDKNKKGKKK